MGLLKASIGAQTSSFDFLARSGMRSKRLAGGAIAAGIAIGIATAAMSIATAAMVETQVLKGRVELLENNLKTLTDKTIEMNKDIEQLASGQQELFALHSQLARYVNDVLVPHLTEAACRVQRLEQMVSVMPTLADTLNLIDQLSKTLVTGELPPAVLSDEILRSVLRGQAARYRSKGQSLDARSLDYFISNLELHRNTIRFFPVDIDKEKLSIAGVLVIPRVIGEPSVTMRCGSIPYPCNGIPGVCLSDTEFLYAFKPSSPDAFHPMKPELCLESNSVMLCNMGAVQGERANAIPCSSDPETGTCDTYIVKRPPPFSVLSLSTGKLVSCSNQTRCSALYNEGHNVVIKDVPIWLQNDQVTEITLGSTKFSSPPDAVPTSASAKVDFTIIPPNINPLPEISNYDLDYSLVQTFKDRASAIEQRSVRRDAELTQLRNSIGTASGLSFFGFGTSATSLAILILIPVLTFTIVWFFLARHRVATAKDLAKMISSIKQTPEIWFSETDYFQQLFWVDKKLLCILGGDEWIGSQKSLESTGSIYQNIQ